MTRLRGPAPTLFQHAGGGIYGHFFLRRNKMARMPPMIGTRLSALRSGGLEPRMPPRMADRSDGKEAAGSPGHLSFQDRQFAV